MYFALKGMTRGADEVMSVHGLSRAHHRALFIMARMEGITVAELAATLRVSKQALHRPLRELQDAGFVSSERDPKRHRFKFLRLTASGRVLEHAASEREREIMIAAFAAAPGARDAWTSVMEKVAECA